MSEEEEPDIPEGPGVFGDESGDGIPQQKGGAGMAGNSGFVSVGKPLAAGGVYAADPTTLGVNLPDDATTSLNVGLKNLGYVSDEGLTNAVETDTQTILDWRGDTVLTVRTSRTETFQWTFIETSEDVLKEVYGPGNVSNDDGELTVIHNGADLPARVYVFEIAMTGNRVKRIVVPNATVTEVGDVQYVAGDAIGYQVTATCLPDASGNTVYEYIAELT